MKNVLCILLLVFAQHAFSQNFSLDEIKLKDTILITQLEKFISDKKKESNLFKKRGYIELKYLHVNKHAKKNDIKYKFSIQDQYFIPKIEKITGPSYYCYMEGKLVLIYDLWLEITEKPKYKKRINRKLKKLLKPFFDKPEHIKVKDSTGKIIINDKDFILQRYNLHGGITLSIFQDGSFKVSKGVY